MKNVDFKDYWNYTRVSLKLETIHKFSPTAWELIKCIIIQTACFAEDYPRSKQQQDHRSTACLALADTLTKLTSFKTESRDTATAQIFNSWPKEHGTKEFKTKLVQKLEQNCNTQCGDRYKSCNFVSAVFLNKRYSDIFQTEINPVKALKYLDVACEGMEINFRPKFRNLLDGFFQDFFFPKERATVFDNFFLRKINYLANDSNGPCPEISGDFGKIGHI